MMSTKSKEALRNSYLEDLLDDYHFLTEEEVKERFGKDSKLFAATYTTLLVECRKYLPHLMKRFVSRGGSIVKRSLKSFEELAEDFDLVFNCSGLGAENLCEDHSMIPVRGQVYKVYAPWIKEALYLDSDTYIIPGVDGAVTLGGTRQFESTREEIDKHDSAGIWERCTQVENSLKDAKILREWVGFRPYRPYVRVEKEIMKFPNGKSIKIVHNYGHGGYGVTSAPGTSLHAVTLGLEFIGNYKKSKL
ncbi:D-aspartate oxidase [Armadillidium vulgare]|nr:D-aspartate oxidase [Armadillidium vulgare]